jgi:uncharacterized SAM-binding protein YcdF (DUF218 family)
LNVVWELKKLFSGMIYPLGTSTFLILLGFLLLLFSQRRRVGVSLALAGFAWLWLWSTPAVSGWARGSLESPWSQLSAEDSPRVDAIVVLGGAFSHKAERPYPNAGSAVDRYWHAARLFHAGKAPRIIVSGGRSPGRGQGMTEAEAGQAFLADLGVPADSIVVESEALTTRGNAVEVAELLSRSEVDRIALVTSALHMRRSLAAFRAVGLDPEPAATDFEVSADPISFRDFLPSAAALADSSRAIHEWVGYWVYWWRGWV